MHEAPVARKGSASRVHGGARRREHHAATARPVAHPMMMPPTPDMMAQPAAVPMAHSFVPPMPPYWAPEAMYMAGLQEMILNQVHYYFSTENLCRDEFLRGHMDPAGGWISISLLASFNRLRQLTTDIGLITETLKLSPELEVYHGSVRKRHGWQQWVYKRSVSPANRTVSPAGDAGLTEASDDAADTAVETGAQPSAPQSPASQPPASTPWRDAASKQLALTAQTVPPSRSSATSAPIALPSPQATAPTAAPVVAVAPAPLPIAPTASAAASSTAVLEQVAAPLSPREEHSSDWSDIDWQRLVENETIGDGDGWIQPSAKGKERRRRGASGSKENVEVTHLSSADSSLCSGKVLLTDELQSEETTLMADEDWASSGTEEPLQVASQAGSTVSQSATLGLTGTSAARSQTTRPAMPSGNQLRKRTSGGRKISELGKGPDKARNRGIKELKDAPPIEGTHPGMLEALDFQLVANHLTAALTLSKGFFARGHAALVALTPRTQALLRAHGHETWLHACMALLVLVLLALAQACPLPPSLLDMTSIRWIELPLGLALAAKINDVSAFILSSFSPVTLRNA